MRLYFYELYKIFSKRNFLFILILLLFINVFFEYKASTDKQISPNAYKAFYEDLEAIDDVEAYIRDEAGKYDIITYFSFGSSSKTELIEKYGDKVNEYIEQFNKGEIVPKYTKHIITEWRFFNNALEHLYTIAGYKQYIANIEDRAHEMLNSPILGQKDTFSYRNIKKTPLAYSHLHNSKLEFGNSEGILALTENKTADLIAIVLIFYICFVLIVYEDENKIFKIIRPTLRGNYHTLAAKIGALFVSCILIYILLYGSLYLTIFNMYGMGDLSTKIQSIKGFLNSTMDVTVLEYLTIYSLSKIAVYFYLGMIVLFLSIVLKNMIAVYLVSFIMTGVNLAAYNGIQEQSIFGFFKHMSIINLLKTNKLYDNYLNINFFGYPVNIITVFSSFIILTIAALVILSIYLFIKQKQISFSTLKVKQLFRKGLPKRSTQNTSLFSHEARRIFMTNKVLIILILLVLFQVYNIKNYTVPYNSDDRIYKNYLQQVGGKITQETYDFINSEEERFAEIESNLITQDKKMTKGEITQDQLRFSQIQIYNELYPRKILDMVKNKLEGLEKLESETGIKAWLVYDTGYNSLTASNCHNDYVSGIIMTLLLSICICPVFAGEYDNGVIKLTRSTRNGRSIIYWYRAALCIAITIIICLSSFLLDLVGILRIYGTEGINAPIQSLEHFSSLSLKISIGQYLAILYSLRLLSSVFLMFIIFSISIMVESTFVATAITQILFIVPLGASLLGAESVNLILFSPLITISPLFQQNNLVALVNSFLVIAIGLIFTFMMYRKRTA